MKQRQNKDENRKKFLFSLFHVDLVLVDLTTRFAHALDNQRRPTFSVLLVQQAEPEELGDHKHEVLESEKVQGRMNEKATSGEYEDSENERGQVLGRYHEGHGPGFGAETISNCLDQTCSSQMSFKKAYQKK